MIWCGLLTKAARITSITKTIFCLWIPPPSVTVELEDMFVVMPAMSLPIRSKPLGRDWEGLGKSLPDGFRYASNTNPQWLTIEQIQRMVAPIEAALVQGQLE